MAQSILDFNLTTTDEKITPRAGTIILGEYIKGLGLEKYCNSNLPISKSNRGFTPFEFVSSLILMLHSGGRSIEDIQQIRQDRTLKEILQIKNIPTSTTILKWLQRTGLMGIYGLQDINKKLIKRYLKRIKDDLTLDMDATVIESNKSTAWTTYKECIGYVPMIGHINGGYIIHSEFRDGNTAPAFNNLEFIQNCIKQLPKNKYLSWVRADAASYQADIFNYCDKEKINYAIGAKVTKNVSEEIDAITNWEPLGNGEYIGEFIHTMPKVKDAFRVIVTKRVHTPMLPHIKELLSDEELEKYNSTRYHAIATNNDKLTALEIVKFYRQRGNTSENQIKELKNGFNLDSLPTSDFISNALYFQIGALAYNLFILFKTILDKKLQHHTIKTIRYKIYNVAGKLINHSRQVTLKIHEEFIGLFQRLRRRAYKVSLE